MATFKFDLQRFADVINGKTGGDQLTVLEDKTQVYGLVGNDTLSSGKGDYTFLYSNGDGKDVIHGFESDHLLQSTDINTITRFYDKSKKEIYFKVGSTNNAITLADFGKTTTFHVNNDTYQLQNNQLKKK